MISSSIFFLLTRGNSITVCNKIYFLISMWVELLVLILHTLQTRKRVLINAFTVRALRDTFSPARGAGIWSSSVDFLTYLSKILEIWSASMYANQIYFSVAGIMALCATSSYYDINEIATRILPNVIVLTIDPDRYKLFISSAFFCPS